MSASSAPDGAAGCWLLGVDTQLLKETSREERPAMALRNMTVVVKRKYLVHSCLTLSPRLHCLTYLHITFTAYLQALLRGVSGKRQWNHLNIKHSKSHYVLCNYYIMFKRRFHTPDVTSKSVTIPPGLELPVYVPVQDIIHKRAKGPLNNLNSQYVQLTVNTISLKTQLYIFRVVSILL